MLIPCQCLQYIYLFLNHNTHVLIIWFLFCLFKSTKIKMKFKIQIKIHESCWIFCNYIKLRYIPMVCSLTFKIHNKLINEDRHGQSNVTAKTIEAFEWLFFIQILPLIALDGNISMHWRPPKVSHTKVYESVIIFDSQETSF